MPGIEGTLAPRLRAKTDTQSGNQTPEDAGKQSSTRKGEEGHKGRRDPEGWTPRGCQRPGCRMRVTKGGEWTSKDGRRRHAERGADMCGGGWQGVGVDDVQVNGVPLRERK